MSLLQALDGSRVFPVVNSGALSGMPTVASPPLGAEKKLPRSSCRRLEACPSDMDWRPLEPGACAVQLPGRADEIRATTRGEALDDHGERRPRKRVLLP